MFLVQGFRQYPFYVELIFFSLLAKTSENYGGTFKISNKKKEILYEINANFDDISLAVKNLIKNALKYSPPEENILIQVEENDKSVRCSFQDFGSGISKPDQEKIFERFYRVDKGRSRKVGGTGLGLAIVKHALDRNNAVIEIVSELDHGSNFTIVFEK